MLPGKPGIPNGIQAGGTPSQQTPTGAYNPSAHTPGRGRLKLRNACGRGGINGEYINNPPFGGLINKRKFAVHVQ